MAGINKVTLFGNLGKDPEVHYTPNGNATCDVSVATTRTWKDNTSGDKNKKKPNGTAWCFMTAWPKSLGNTSKKAGSFTWRVT